MFVVPERIERMFVRRDAGYGVMPGLQAGSGAAGVIGMTLAGELERAFHKFLVRVYAILVRGRE